MFTEFIKKVTYGNSLTENEAEQAMQLIMEGRATPAQIGAFLTALVCKGENEEEIAGFARTMRHFAIAVKGPKGLVDTCGTGGDGKFTYNISTAAAFIVAGLGIPVAKHGNRSVSSRAGSADVLEALGVNIDLSPEGVEACLNEVGLGFIFAPRFHQAMRHAAGPRKEIGIRTVFNLLGPLTNPACPDYQLVGVYAPHLTEPVASVLSRLGCKEAFVVHGMDGLDEVTLAAPTKVTRVKGGVQETFIFHPRDAGMSLVPLGELVGQGAQENARIIREVLAGRRGPKRDAALVNAAFALWAAGVVSDVKEGITMARESVDSGKAAGKLEELIRFTRSWAA